MAPQPHAAAHPRVLQCAIRDKAALHAAFIPTFIEGGIFVACTESFPLGSEIAVLLTLPDSEDHLALTGKVGWINPAHATGGRQQGVGVRFPDTEEGARLRARIERILGGPAPAHVMSQTV